MDIEMTKKCAEAMGITLMPHSNLIETGDGTPAISAYNPLHDDAQAMALVKKFGLNVEYFYWQGPRVSKTDAHGNLIAEAQHQESDTLNRSIVECVSKTVKP